MRHGAGPSRLRDRPARGRRRLARPDGARPARGERRPDRAGRARQGRVGHGARRPRARSSCGADADHRRRRLRRPAARPRPRQHLACSRIRPCVGRSCVLLDGRDPGDPAPTRARPTRDLSRGRIGDLVSLLPFGDGVTGITTTGLALPAPRRAAASSGRPAACRTSATARPPPAITVRHGPSAHRGITPATHLAPMSTPASRRPRLPRSPSPTRRHDPPAGRPARPLDHRLLLSRGRHVRLHDGGLPVPRPPRDHRARAPTVWGVSPDGAASHAQVPRRSSACRSPSSPTRTTPWPTAYGAWALKKNYGKKYMGIVRSSFLIDPRGRIAHVWPKVKADGHAADVLETYRRSGRTPDPMTVRPARPRPGIKEASRVGGDVRSLGRDAKPSRRAPATR